MAEFYGVNYAQTTTTPSGLVPSGDYGGCRFGSFDQYTTLGTEDAGSVIYMGRLPPKARIIGGYLHHGAAGAGVTVKIGDGTVDDRILPAASIASAGHLSFTADSIIGYLNTTGRPVDVMVTTGGATADAGCVLTLSLEWQAAG